MKKIAVLLLVCTLMAVTLSGCYFNEDFGIGNYMTGESYPDAGNYQTGTFSYDTAQVQTVEVYWRSGKIEIVESDEAELKVSESGGELSEDASMHYWVDDGVLRIRFCASEAKIHVKPSDKHLTIEVPKGIVLSIHTTSAPVWVGTLTQNSILISTHSGNIEIDSMDATDIDLSSSSGRISVEDISAESLRCHTSSGSVHMKNFAADTSYVETGSGNIELGLIAAESMEIYTSSGKTDLQLPECGAEIAYTTSSGNLHCVVEYQCKGDLYVFGNGESKISVDTSSGNLNIKETK